MEEARQPVACDAPQLVRVDVGTGIATVPFGGEKTGEDGKPSNNVGHGETPRHRPRVLLDDGGDQVSHHVIVESGGATGRQPHQIGG
jgi:hypothetical protein